MREKRHPSATETKDIKVPYAHRLNVLLVDHELNVLLVDHDKDLSRDTSLHNELASLTAQPDDIANDGFLAYEADCVLLENVLAESAHTRLEFEAACEWLEALPSELPQIAALNIDAAYAWLDRFLNETAHDGSWDTIDGLCASLEESLGETTYDELWDFEAAYAWLYDIDVYWS